MPGYIDPWRQEQVGPFSIPKSDTPLQAIEQFVKENRDFEIDESRERYILTENYRGFLRRRDV